MANAILYVKHLPLQTAVNYREKRLTHCGLKRKMLYGVDRPSMLFGSSESTKGKNFTHFPVSLCRSIERLTHSLSCTIQPRYDDLILKRGQHTNSVYSSFNFFSLFIPKISHCSPVISDTSNCGEVYFPTFSNKQLLHSFLMAATLQIYP